MNLRDTNIVSELRKAATALVHGMTVVTRNHRDFEGTGVALLNPWDAAGG